MDFEKVPVHQDLGLDAFLTQVTTLIGYGSPNKAGTHDVHGAALGPDETAAARKQLQWKYGEFEIPQEAYDVFGRAKDAGAKAEKTWEASLQAYGQKYPEVRLHVSRCAHRRHLRQPQSLAGLTLKRELATGRVEWIKECVVEIQRK